MKLCYLGTGAGFGIPEMFCSCRVCDNARQQRGKDIRTRSQAVIDDIISIDFPVDAFLHSLYSGLDMRNIEHILITHNHFDHFMHQELFTRVQGVKGPCRLYLSEASGRTLLEAVEKRKEDERAGKRTKTTELDLELNIIKPFVPFDISGYKITPLPARHAANVEPVIFLIESAGKTLLWAHDTGPLPDSTLDYLGRQDLVIDFMSLDCTLERGKCITSSHMDFEQCLETAALLEEAGRSVKGKTRVMLSHIGHLTKLSHREQVEEAVLYGIEVAYDGLTVVI